MKTIDVAERRRRLARRHYLAAPATSPEQVAGGLVGLHSSDPATVFLSLQSRLDVFDVTDLEASLYEERSLLRMLGMRRTMFVVPRDLGSVMNTACTQSLVAGQRRRLLGYLETNELSHNEAWLAGVEAKTMDALARIGPATARELKEEVPELNIKLNVGPGQFGLSTRVLFLLATANQIVRTRPLGGWTSTQYRWARTDMWTADSSAEMETDQARSELVSRWLRTYGPGTLTDIKWWTGWGLRVTRDVLDRCGAVAVEVDGNEAFVLPDDLEASEAVEPWAALLPGLDSTVMGWKERQWYLGDYATRLFDRNGNAGPTVWLDGRVVGGWNHSATGEVRLAFFEDFEPSGTQLIEDRADALETWLGDRRFVPRFRTPTEKLLSS